MPVNVLTQTLKETVIPLTKVATDGVTLLQRFCTEADARNVLQCLKQNKNSELMDPKCKQMITKRQITQNTGQREKKTLGTGAMTPECASLTLPSSALLNLQTSG